MGRRDKISSSKETLVYKQDLKSDLLEEAAVNFTDSHVFGFFSLFYNCRL